MKALAWTVLVGGGLVWSGLAWFAWHAVDWAGAVASRNADLLTVDPETVVWLSSAAGLIATLGQGGIVAIWLLGLTLLGAPAVLLLARRGRRAGPEHPVSRPDPARPTITDVFLWSRRFLPLRDGGKGAG